MPVHEVVIVLDVGGSSLKSGLVRYKGDIERFQETPYDSLTGIEQLHDVFVNQIEELWHPAKNARVVGLGVSMPGPFNYRRGISYIRGQEKFEALYGQSLPDAWRQRAPYLAEIPIEFVNDAHAFALGELAHGAATAFGKVLFVTLGTGCGSAFADHGQLLTQGKGVPSSGYIYDLPYGSERLDDVLSSRGVAALWKEQDGEEKPVHELALLAFQGVVRATETFRRFGVRLADALSPTLVNFRPDAVILGGKIAQSFDLFAATARQRLTSLKHPPELHRAKNIDGAALQGAGQIVFDRMEKNS